MAFILVCQCLLFVLFVKSVLINNKRNENCTKNDCSQSTVKKENINQIEFQRTKKMCNDDVTRNISKDIPIDDTYETTIEMKTECHDQASFESNKELIVVIGKDKPKKMKEQFHILKYKQITPNWFAFYMNKRNHEDIIESY